MLRYQAEPVLNRRFMLGEGPFYLPDSDTFCWVDIKTGSLFSLSLATGSLEEVQVGQYLGAAVPTKRGRFVLAMTTGLYLLEDKKLRLLCRPPELTANQRVNDGKCDPAGRFLFGTMDILSAGEPPALFSLDTDGSVRVILEGVKLSNGLAWNKAGDTFYYNDTPTKRVDAFDYDLATGHLSNRRTVFRAAEGMPDGMTIDAEGKLWLALWGASKIVRVDPENGEILGEVPVPSTNTSSCCFAGKNLDTLYITTSGETFSDLGEGLLYRAKPGVIGTPTDVFDDTAL